MLPAGDGVRDDGDLGTNLRAIAAATGFLVSAETDA